MGNGEKTFKGYQHALTFTHERDLCFTETRTEGDSGNKAEETLARKTPRKSTGIDEFERLDFCMHTQGYRGPRNYF